MGLVAAGVNGMKLDDKDEVVGMEIFPIEGEALLMTSDGKAKVFSRQNFHRRDAMAKAYRFGVYRGRQNSSAL